MMDGINRTEFNHSLSIQDLISTESILSDLNFSTTAMSTILDSIEDGRGLNHSLSIQDLTSTESIWRKLDFNSTAMSSMLHLKENVKALNSTPFISVDTAEIFEPNIPFLIATLSFALITGIANILIIICIVGVPRLRTTFNTYICSLAVADLIVGVCVTPFVVIYIVNPTWPIGITMCTIWCILDYSSCTISMLHLCLLAYERYLAIVKPMQHLNHVTALRTSISLVFIWVFGLAIWVGPVLYFRDPKRFVIYEDECIYEAIPPKEFNLCQSIVTYYCPIVFMLYLYGRIIIELKPKQTKGSSNETCNKNTLKQSHVNISNIAKKQTISKEEKAQTVSVELVSISYHIDGNGFDTDRAIGNGERIDMRSKKQKLNYGQTLKKSRQEQEMSRRRKQQLRCVRTLGVVMVTFLICWVPYCIVMPLMAFCPNCVSYLLYDFSLAMTYCNSSLNPLIYFALNKSFRIGLKRLFSKQRESGTGISTSMGSTIYWVCTRSISSTQ